MATAMVCTYKAIPFEDWNDAWHIVLIKGQKAHHLCDAS